ncbi:hypothetical protein [Lacrimispora indolis]|uniref:hypothetical protein n=1 Tax=Lacrimispora indolis TaxID=69825 RepID=UPI0012EBC983|nr:hypothetical protein [[Clostridium] methoxybenzovorans]
MDIPLVLEDPTKEVIGTDADGGETGLTEDGEIAYDSGPYGDLGKSTFDALAGAWVKGNITTEASLREIMDATYGDFSNKEALTKEILAMPRNAQPTQVAQETQSAPQETKSETKSQSQSGTATPPTKADTTQPTNSGAQSTAPATDYWSSLTPEQRAELEAEAEKNRQYDLAHPAQGDGSGTPGNNDWVTDNPAEQWGWN